MEEKVEKMRKQREREEIAMELVIRRVEMLLLEKMGLTHIDFIRQIGEQVRAEAGL